ncbi:inactive phospholipase D5 isoform X1 [Synchiropus splendidus]|uniref:inactive phospholipase D5 isoform X1 n=1 Tax=Synchiropus splendidus TaxID=270530 RepID=UPI00237E171A|nr:inactive phospholipase D5 isoform X1 [Synchiropus splendidus]
MELSNDPRLRVQEEAPPAPLTHPSQAKSSSHNAAQQQRYSASVFLRQKDKLEQTQQKCIAIFALVCCFAILVALTCSSVNIWGSDEDGITEENCSRDCQGVVVENVPEELSLLVSRNHVPLMAGFHMLLDQAKYSVEVVSPVWNLNSWDQMSSAAKQGQSLFQRLLGLKSRGVRLKITSGLTNSAELKTLAAHNAEVHFVNMTAFTRGGLHSSFWVVDRTHIYVGSADMDWRSFSKRKELGVMMFNCSCLALDLHRIFSFYWQLHERDYIPNIWSKRVTALYGAHNSLELQINDAEASAYVSTSPELFCAKDRTRDVDAIYDVIQRANTFVYISVTDYLPLLSQRSRGNHVTRYWSPLDEAIREAVVLRGVRVRLLISFWEKTHPLTFNFVASLKSLCMHLQNCSVEVRFFWHKEQTEDDHYNPNHNKYVVTDNALYVGNHDWVGSNFAVNAGVGLVIKMENHFRAQLREQVKAAFERDWLSRYAKSLHSGKELHDKYQTSKLDMGPDEEKWNDL